MKSSNRLRLPDKEKSMRQLLKMLRDCQGATAIEYGLIAALVATMIVLGFGAITNNLGAIFDLIITTLENAMA